MYVSPSHSLSDGLRTVSMMLLVRSNLRHAICLLLLERRQPMRVAEIAAVLEGRGYLLRGRPSQAVSDVLRTEVRCGRVLKLDHGLYGAG
jgi:hypothetical protein